MIKSLGRVLWAFITDTWCRHEWENVEEFFIWKHDLWGTEHLTSAPTQPGISFAKKGKVYHQRCAHCGEMRSERISI